MWNTTSNNIQTYRGNQFFMEETGVPWEKKTDLPQFSDKRYYRILYRVHLVTELTTVLVIDTKCNGKCNSNYYAKRVRHRWPFEFTQNLLSYIKNVIKGMFTFDLFFDRFAW
jgi:hypothetical protein